MADIILQTFVHQSLQESKGIPSVQILPCPTVEFFSFLKGHQHKQIIYLIQSIHLLIDRITLLHLLYGDLPFFRLKHNSQSSKTVFSLFSPQSHYISTYVTQIADVSLCVSINSGLAK